MVSEQTTISDELICHKIIKNWPLDMNYNQYLKEIGLEERGLKYKTYFVVNNKRKWFLAKIKYGI